MLVHTKNNRYSLISYTIPFYYIEYGKMSWVYVGSLKKLQENVPSANLVFIFNLNNLIEYCS